MKIIGLMVVFIIVAVVISNGVSNAMHGSPAFSSVLSGVIYYALARFIGYH